jgi:RimJ/RimL family protein N-acetyltransferase
MPSLDTDRLVVQPFRPDDLDDLFRIVDCDCFGDRSPEDDQAKSGRKKWLDWNIAGYEQHFQLGHPPYGDRAVRLKSDDRLIGVCGLVTSFGPFQRLLDGRSDASFSSAEIGLFYCIDSEYRRRGFATEAASLLIEFAFERLQLQRIIATTQSANAASIQVMRQLGMTIHFNEEEDWPEVVGCRQNGSPTHSPSE